jgi:ATP synthase F1 gamma subunit
MKIPRDIERDKLTVDTLVELTGAFEGIASMRIAQIKNQVLQATQFFHELWSIYSQLRVDESFRFGRSQSAEAIIDKELFIIITSEGGFSGDIDEKLIQNMLSLYDPDKNDILVVGYHGAVQLTQRDIHFKKYFRLPSKDQNINVTPLAKEIQQYRNTSVFYQQYVSLTVQDIKRIELSSVVQQQGKKAETINDVISEKNYIFEPTSYDVIDHLERSMLQIAMSQLILDSKLAQYASRFTSMSASHQRSIREKDRLSLIFNRAKRAVKDERLKEMINGLRKTKVNS